MTQTRRTLIAGAAAIPLATAAASLPALAGTDDAELLRLSVRLEQMEKEWIEVTVPDLKNLAASKAGMPDPCESMTDDQNDDFTDRLIALVDEIQAHQAVTLTGLAVLTRAAVLENATQWVNGDGDARDRLFIEAACKFLGITSITEIALAAV